MRRLWLAAVIALSCAPTLIPAIARATVTTSKRSVVYTGNGTVGPFTITYPFSNTSWITVTKTLIASPYTATPLVNGYDFTVTLPVGSTNGYITLIGAYSGGISSSYTITIARVVPYTQTTSFKTQGAFRPAAHEEAFDKLTEEVQQLADGAALTSDVDAAIEAHDGAADPHTGYLLLAGRAGGQHAKGGSASGENLWLESTANATKGKLLFGSGGTELVVDDVNNVVGIGTATPSSSYKLDVTGAVRLGSSSGLILDNNEISQNATNQRLYLHAGTSAAQGAKLELRGSTYAGGAAAYMYSAGFVNNTAAGTPGQLLDPANGLYLYTGSGALQFTHTDASVVLGDNDSTALDIGASGATNILRFDTTNGSEKVIASALSVTGDASLGGGAGAATFTDTNSSILLPDNDSTAFDVGATGATNMMRFDTTNAAEKIILGTSGTSAFDSANNRLGIGTASPSTNTLEVVGTYSGRRHVMAKTGSYSIDPTTDCESVIYSGNGAATITLPSPGTYPGCTVTLVNGNAAGTATVAFSPGVSDGIYGTCIGSSTAGTGATITTNLTLYRLAGTADKDAQNVGSGAGTAQRQDTMTVTACSANKWCILDCLGLWITEP